MSLSNAKKLFILRSGLNLAQIINQHIWIYAFDPEQGVYSDNPGVTPIADGEAARTWNDITGSVAWAQTGAESTCPTYYKNAYKGRAALYGDGGDLMDATVSPLVGNLNTYVRYTLYLAAPSDGAFRFIVSECSSSNAIPFVKLWYADTSTVVRSTHRDDANVQSQRDATQDMTVTPHVVLEVRNAADDFALRVDGVEQDTDSSEPTTTTTNRLVLFGHYSGGSPVANGQGYMIFHGARNTLADMAVIEAQLMAFAGIS